MKRNKLLISSVVFTVLAGGSMPLMAADQLQLRDQSYGDDYTSMFEYVGVPSRNQQGSALAVQAKNQNSYQNMDQNSYDGANARGSATAAGNASSAAGGGFGGGRGSSTGRR